jgi:hypothetical protein
MILIEMDQRPAFLTESLAAETLEIAERAFILPFFNFGGAKRPFIHIVILGKDGEIIAERSYGHAREGQQFEDQCKQIARSKAKIHYRTGRPSAEVHRRAPHLLLVGDTVYGGSAEHEGLYVGASGIQDYFDEALAASVAAFCWARCREAWEAFNDEKGGQYLYPEPAFP